MELTNTLNIIYRESKSLNKVKSVLLVMYIALETLYPTIFGLYLGASMERLQCVVAILLIALLAVEFFRLDRNNKCKWFKKNILVIGYFVIRLITFVHVGMEYTMLRSMLFEIVYLLVLTELIVNSKFCKKILFKILIVANLVINIVTVVIYWYCNYVIANLDYATNKLFGFIVSNTYIETMYELYVKETYYNVYFSMTNSSLYSNPNIMGIMTALAVLISLAYLSKKMSKKKIALSVLYYVFSVYCVLITDCSNAVLGLALSLIAVVVIKFIDRKKLICLFIVCAILSTGAIYGFIAINHGNTELTKLEQTIESLSTQRYTIWKDCYYSHKEEIVLGCGNITLEKRDRYQYNLDKGIDYGHDVNGSLKEFFGPHNGYIGMISCAGILGSLMFLLAFIKRIVDCKALNRKSWYLPVLFLLFINLFECMIVINKNFCCLYLFLILALNDSDETEKLVNPEATK